MAKVHYHCISGDHGYMPDFNTGACSTRAQALDIACGYAQDLRSEGIKVYGRKQEGYYEVPDRQGAGLEYIEVTECMELACLEDPDF